MIKIMYKMNGKNNTNLNKFVIIFLLVLIAILGIYFINNYNQFKVYEIKGSSDNFGIGGIATFNKELNIFHISKINYNGITYGENGSFKLIKDIKISLVTKEGNDEKFIASTKSEFSEPESLVKYLKEADLYLSEWYGYEELFTKKTMKKINEILYVKVELTDEEDIKFTDYIKVNGTLYSNNKFFYKKAKKGY